MPLLCDQNVTPVVCKRFTEVRRVRGLTDLLYQESNWMRVAGKARCHVQAGG